MNSLLGKYLSGQTTAAEDTIVTNWIDASEANRAEFQLLQKLWNRSGEQQEIIFDTNKAWQAVNAKINTAKAPARTINLFTRRSVIAAAAVVIIFLGLWWMFGQNLNTTTVYADVEVKEVQLQDGSKVYLHKGASLKYPKKFSEHSREVSLTGEAFFEVTHDAAKPFRIEAAQAAVEVVGTSFSVNTNNDKVELIVKTGRVKFGAPHDASRVVLVSAGERALFAQNTVKKELNKDENFNAWQSGQLVFNNTPLREAAAVLGNYYHVNIRLKKEDAAQLSPAQLTARFNNQSLPSVLQEISLITSYHIQQVSEGNYEISIK